MEATRGRTAASNEYVSCKRGDIGAEFEFLRNNLRHCAKLTSPLNAPKPKGNLGTLPQSTDQGETSDTRLACGTVPHPALEMGMDENPKLLSVIRSGEAKVSGTVVT